MHRTILPLLAAVACVPARAGVSLAPTRAVAELGVALSPPAGEPGPALSGALAPGSELGAMPAVQPELAAPLPASPDAALAPASPLAGIPAASPVPVLQAAEEPTAAGQANAIGRAVLRESEIVGAAGKAAAEPLEQARGESSDDSAAAADEAFQALLGRGATVRPTKADDNGPLALTQVVESRLAAAKNSPEMKRYLQLLGELGRSWGEPPFQRSELTAVQRKLADSVGLALDDVNGMVAVAPRGGHWLNRWVGGIRRTMGLLLLWNPLNNHFTASGASYDSKGWIWGDNLGPLLSGPSSELFHEFLHAYFHRGRLARKFAPLMTQFHNLGWKGYPHADKYAKAGYTNSNNFRSDEVLTNLHSVYDRARKITATYGKEGAAWVPSAPEAAPKEVQELLDRIDTPVFLSDTQREMAASLLPGVSRLARLGLEGRSLKKNYDRFNGAIPFEGEIEENKAKDIAFYAFPWKERAKDVDVRYFSMGSLRQENKNPLDFPVLFGNGSYFARKELSLSAVAKLDLDDPRHQDIIIRAAAEALAPKLRELKRLNEVLAPALERLRALQARGRERVDLALVREIQQAAYAAFLQGVRFFTRQPDAPPIGLRRPGS